MAIVVGLEKGKIKVHFYGYHSKWNEWIDTKDKLSAIGSQSQEAAILGAV
jgi:hypothetical protein